MKSKTYRYGNVTFKAIHKAVGNGWETTIWYAGKPIFVGNFIHAKRSHPMVESDEPRNQQIRPQILHRVQFPSELVLQFLEVPSL